MKRPPIRLTCRDCDLDVDGVSVIPEGWIRVLEEQTIQQAYLRSTYQPWKDCRKDQTPWWTHTGICPECAADYSPEQKELFR